MNIELLKKLEDLKQTKKQYFMQLSKKNDQKKSQYINDVVDDFSKFFQEKGFEITSANGLSEASYGKLKATLSHKDPSVNYMGVQFRFDLDLSSLNMSKIIVVLNRTKPGFSFSTHISSGEPELKDDILRIEKEIEEAETKLKNFDTEKWLLFINNEKSNPGYQFSEPYTSMYELLSDLIK